MGMGLAGEGIEGPRSGSKYHLCQTDKSEWVRERPQETGVTFAFPAHQRSISSVGPERDTPQHSLSALSLPLSSAYTATCDNIIGKISCRSVLSSMSELVLLSKGVILGVSTVFLQSSFIWGVLPSWQRTQVKDRQHQVGRSLV